MAFNPVPKSLKDGKSAGAPAAHPAQGKGVPFGKKRNSNSKVPFPQYDYPNSKISPFTGKPYTKSEALAVHKATVDRDKKSFKGSPRGKDGPSTKPSGKGSPWQKFVAGGHQVGPRKGSVWSNHVDANKKSGGKVLWPDSKPSSSRPSAGHSHSGWGAMEGKKKSAGGSTKQAALSAAAKRAIERNKGRRT